MPKQKIDVIENVKKKYVRMALESGKMTSIARKAGISRATFKKWMDEYEDEVLEVMEQEGVATFLKILRKTNSWISMNRP
jgi:transposase-like protein